MMWNRKDKYEDLPALLLKEKRYGVLRIIRDEGGLHSRQTTMVSLFNDTVRVGDDVTALAAARWVMRATEDIRLHRLIDEDGVLPRNGEVSAARELADRDKASEAMSLLKTIPDESDKEIIVRINEDCDTEARTVKTASMPLTKGFLLPVIVRRWRETDDEEEADRLFAFLCDLKLKHAEDRELLEKLAREEGTIGRRDKDNRAAKPFPSERAARHFLELMRRKLEKGSHYSHELAGVARLLSIAWVRNGSDEQRTNWMRAVLPAFGSSDAVFDALAASADRLAGVDREVSSLRDSLRPLLGREASLSVSYSFFGQRGRREDIVVRLVAQFHRDDPSLSRFYATSSGPQFDPEKAQDKFQEMFGRVKDWQAAHDELAVEVELLVTNDRKPEVGEYILRRARTIA